MKTTNKVSIQNLVEICYVNGLRDIVFSPGSRNAPLVIAFNTDDRFNVYCIPDERVAAFYALGISLKKRTPCMLCCTSGTASLNYAPAIAEAYYQNIPLLILTADRPENKIDQGIGQSIRQNNVYNNYIEASFQLSSKDDIYTINQNKRIITKGIGQSILKQGPVHINIPLEEPLYNLVDKSDSYLSIPSISNTEINKPDFKLKNGLKSIWTSAKRKIIILGQGIVNSDLETKLNQLISNGEIILLTETCANVYCENSIQCIDRVLTGVVDNEEKYRPDLLIYLHGQIISKKIIRYFTDYPAKYQWYVDPYKSQDTFESLTAHIAYDNNDFINEVSNYSSQNDRDFNQVWLDLNSKIQLKHNQYIPTIPYSDLKVFDFLLLKLPDDTVLHMSNSSSVRYVQLFDQRKGIEYHANRGVSGIDGCTTTAMGYSKVSDKNNLLITGDVSFFYDSNAFWHPHIPDNLKIILINNGGGGIFRIIDGPNNSGHLEQFFEAHHTLQAEQFSKAYGLEYFRADSMESLIVEYKKFSESESKSISLLEIITPRLENSDVLKSYFKSLK
ncbi:2-succinyl-5-enolpyruvyl-6-hydroxy-3-cyclohexene-1-carboxylic-acid synthase [Saprospiraceae bacterium]|nr:2-succinyl-5-enolpyruvyl-6-hydroxy-3-cyclohexene-1-carboxylic-acid synthase [Saprospiraceae bacterium]